jgi:hypothetical protein
MRTFKTDKPEVFAFKLDASDTVYELPLLASMPLSMSMLLTEAEKEKDPDACQAKTFEAEVAIIRRYCGDAILDEVGSATVGEIVTAWLEASGIGGASAGES